MKTLVLKDAGQTMAAAARLARAGAGGSAVCLYGPLGSGKTTFVRGFLRGLGFKGGVRSPTFELVHEYRRTEPRVFHMDLYRLKPAELANLPFREYLADEGAVSLIEWPEAAESLLPADRLELRLDHAPGKARTLKARALGPSSRRLLGAWLR
ncbi:MAG TPA: tRNA (adenosine(37)-N6)-threonylcarbamoyltransferase complex ATPase subunit type 1 TsaE [Elusimicrobia bacterium]|nr:tRNA (adenosine(37)-N6)-threonylcarbamoyltransferase complex ATPase subunit type 1 TsaE [Elusimicrobiota bacterium]